MLRLTHPIMVDADHVAESCGTNYQRIADGPASLREFQSRPKCLGLNTQKQVATPLGDKHTRAASARREATRPCRGTMGDTRGLAQR